MSESIVDTVYSAISVPELLQSSNGDQALPGDRAISRRVLLREGKFARGVHRVDLLGFLRKNIHRPCDVRVGEVASVGEDVPLLVRGLGLTHRFLSEWCSLEK